MTFRVRHHPKQQPRELDAAELGQMLRVELKKRGITQTDAASTIGVVQSLVSDAVRGEAVPAAIRLIEHYEIARVEGPYYDVDLLTLFTD